MPLVHTITLLGLAALHVPQAPRGGAAYDVAPAPGTIHLAQGPSSGGPGKSRAYKFIDAKGSAVYTNRVQKYRRDPRYVEVNFDYKPVVVPQWYKKPSARAVVAPEEIMQLIESNARRYNVDTHLIHAVIKLESAFDARAVSKAGARGLMQLMPGTAAEMGVRDIFDPAQNIAGGTQYLSKLLELFKGDLRLAAAAYNAGPGRVKQYGGVPPFKETQAYVRNVLALRDDLAGLEGSEKLTRIAAATPSSSAASKTAFEKEPYIVYFRSGLTQPAERVAFHSPKYYITYNNRTYILGKELVDKVVKRQ